TCALPISHTHTHTHTHHPHTHTPSPSRGPGSEKDPQRWFSPLQWRAHYVNHISYCSGPREIYHTQSDWTACGEKQPAGPRRTHSHTLTHTHAHTRSHTLTHTHTHTHTHTPGHVHT